MAGARPEDVRARLVLRPGADRHLPNWLGPRRRVTHLRVGSSTCRGFFPTPEEIQNVVEEAGSRELGVQLATPLVHDGDLHPIRQMLVALGRGGAQVELVANDWGVVALARSVLPDLQIVAGRLLNLQFKDPRLDMVAAERLGRTPPTWQLGAALSPAWQALARELGIRRVELDWPLHGLDSAAWSRAGLALSLHLPRVLVASGRTCVLRDPRGAVDRQRRGERCNRECESMEIALDPAEHRGGARRIRRGNCEQVALDRGALDRALAWADSADGPDRLVLHPEAGAR